MPRTCVRSRRNKTTVRITEIFHSIQGEGVTAGIPTVFVRLTGCPLRCRYCDTAYAFTGGDLLDIETVVSEVQSFATKYVTVTGGEPLAQPSCIDLLSELCDEGDVVSLETSGALDIAEVDPRVSIVLDLKTPGSGEVARNLDANILRLRKHDQVKFVICNREDYEWSRMMLTTHSLSERTKNILFSPSWEELDAGSLADWILADELPVRMQVQLHKVLWGDVPGR